VIVTIFIVDDIKTHSLSETHAQNMLNKANDAEAVVQNNLPVLIVRSELTSDGSTPSSRRRSYPKRYRTEWEADPELQGSFPVQFVCTLILILRLV